MMFHAADRLLAS